MGHAKRGVIAPAVIGISAATALVQFAPAASAAANHPTKAASADSTDMAGAKAKPAVTPPGCTESTSPDYGCGKLTVEAEPVASTFPADATPDATALTGLTFAITGPVANDDTLYAAENTCLTGQSPSTVGNECPESYGGIYQNPSTMVTSDGTWVAGESYQVALDTATSKAAPLNSLIPAISGTFPDCTAYQVASPTGPSGCADTTVVKVYGTYHYIGLKVISSLTKKPVAKASYALCSPTSGTPAKSTKSCPAGSSTLATATSNSKGVLVFPSVYSGSTNYSVVPTKEPTGYHQAKSQQFDVPVVTTAAQSGALVAATAKLAPVKTTVKTHSVTTTEGEKVTIKAFSGAKHVVGPLRLIKLGAPKHGKVHHHGGKITYTPRGGFTGRDVFTYTVRNAVGVKVTGKIVVRVDV